MIIGLPIGLNRPNRVINPNPDLFISDIFDLTPGQVSSTSIGWRLSPPIGELGPDNLYAGGNLDLILITDGDIVTIKNQAGTQFPDSASDNVRVSIGPYVGPGAMVCVWDTIDRYTVSQPGIYAYMQDLLGVPTTIRLSTLR